MAEYKNGLFTITSNFIAYIKEARKAAGSVTATILWQQMEHNFGRKKYQPFYKFMEPCDHPAYTERDSWCEELAFSPDEFRNAFSKIGVKYDSKKEFIASQEAGEMFFNEKGEEKMYAAYYDKLGRQTFYYRNHQLVEKQLFEITFGTPPSPQMAFPSPETNFANLAGSGNPIPIYTDIPTEITYRDILFLFSFNLMSLETDASVREAFEKCSDEEKKYLSWDNTKCTLTVNLPKKKPIYIVSLSKMSKLSHDNLSLLISHLNPFYSHPFFEDYFTHLEGCRFQSALKITRDLDMQPAKDPSEDEKDIYNLH